MSSSDNPASSSFLLRLLFAGVLAIAAFDLFGQGISPWFGFAKLSPVGLAQSTINTITGVNSNPAAHILHYITGIIAYPLGWIIIVKPLAKKFAPQFGWFLVSVAYGVGLWVFALFVMASLVAGMPMFLGFTGITWVALLGHIIFAVVAAWVLETRRVN